LTFPSERSVLTASRLIFSGPAYVVVISTVSGPTSVIEPEIESPLFKITLSALPPLAPIASANTAPTHVTRIVIQLLLRVHHSKSAQSIGNFPNMRAPRRPLSTNYDPCPRRCRDHPTTRAANASLPTRSIPASSIRKAPPLPPPVGRAIPSVLATIRSAPL